MVSRRAGWPMRSVEYDMWGRVVWGRRVSWVRVGIGVERGIAWRKSHGGWVTVMGCEVTRECVMMGLHRSFSPFGWAVYVCVNGPE